MIRLQRAALAAESSLRTAGTLEPTLRQDLINQMSVVLDAIKLLDQPDSTEKSTHIQPEETRELLDRLRHHLEEADGEAENLWVNHKAQFANLFSPVEMARIERAISNWDFDQALASLLRSTPENEKK